MIGQRDVRSSRGWLNPTIVRGGIFTLAGITVLLVPDPSLQFVRFVGGAGLVVSGGSGIWGHRRSGGGVHGLLRALLALAAGLGLVLAPIATVRAAAWVVGSYLAASALVAAHRSLARHRDDASPRSHVARSALLLSAALLLFAMPEAMFRLAVASAAVGAVVTGLVMVAWTLRHGSSRPTVADRAHASEVFWEWLGRSDLGADRRAAVAETLYFEEPDRASKLTAYVVMLLLSVGLASLAILQDSTAVIIGAMLVAPLMTPIMGCAAGLVAGWRERVLKSLGVVAASVVAAIGLAWVLAAWIPGLVPLDANSQVLTRASPTLLDMAIALVAGAAGAYATVDDRVSSSLTGVAIAVALVPPLGVVGITLEDGRLAHALGALLLFATNLVSIILASALVFVLVGFVPMRKESVDRVTHSSVMASVAIVALLIMLPLGLTGREVLSESERTDAATRQVVEWLGSDSTLRLLEVRVREGQIDVALSGSGQPPDLESLQESLNQASGSPVTVRLELFPSMLITTSDTERAESDSTQVSSGGANMEQ